MPCKAIHPSGQFQFIMSDLLWPSHRNRTCPKYRLRATKPNISQVPIHWDYHIKLGLLNFVVNKGHKLASTTSTQSTSNQTRHPSIAHYSHYQTILLNNQNTAYPTPIPSGNMIHGRHRGVSLNFQAKIPTARMPKIVPMILGSIDYFPSWRTAQVMDFNSGNDDGVFLIDEDKRLWPRWYLDRQF